jgi:uncharacterized protein YejL (UPF0352 family)
MTTKKTVPINSYGIYIGDKSAQVEQVRMIILEVLNGNNDQKTKQLAIKVLGNMVSAPTNISNCNINMEK